MELVGREAEEDFPLLELTEPLLAAGLAPEGRETPPGLEPPGPGLAWASVMVARLNAMKRTTAVDNRCI